MSHSSILCTLLKYYHFFKPEVAISLEQKARRLMYEVDVFFIVKPNVYAHFCVRTLDKVRHSYCESCVSLSV